MITLQKTHSSLQVLRGSKGSVEVRFAFSAVPLSSWTRMLRSAVDFPRMASSPRPPRDRAISTDNNGPSAQRPPTMTNSTLN